jgi:hypothetical protein
MNSLLAIPYDMTVTSVPSTGAGSSSNMASNRVGLVHRTTAPASSGAYDYVFDLGSAKSVDCLALLWCNILTTDTITITGADNSAISTNAVTVVNAVNAYTGAAVAGAGASVTSFGKKLAYTFAATARRYWRVRIVSTAGNGDGYEISRVAICQRHDFGVDYSALELLSDDRGQVEQSDYGEDIEDARRISFGWRVRWRFGSQAEMLASHQRFTMLGQTKPILFCPMPSATNAQDLLAFGKMRNPARTGSELYDIWDFGFEVYSEAA